MMLPKPVGRQQIVLALQDRIQRGDYAPGSWLPAERALASEFGTDRSAVRGALLQLEHLGLIVRETGKRPWVRSDQAAPQPPRHKVQGQPAAKNSAAAQADSNAASRTPPKTELQTIAAILPQHPIFPAALALMHGINAALRTAEAPFRLQVIDTHGGSGRREISLEKTALDSVIHEKVAGVVLWHLGGAETLPQVQDLERHGVPVVFVDRFPAELACDYVGSDNHAGTQAAVEYLHWLGHRRIAYLTTGEDSTAVAERLAAYLETMQRGGEELGPRWKQDWIHTIPNDRTFDVAPACDQFFALAAPPTAVLALNDALAYHFIAECQKRGKQTPEDISVIGFDDLEEHSPRPPLLTTVHQSFDKMGRRAAELLLNRLSEPDQGQVPRRHILLPTPLVKRSTCRPISGTECR